MVRSKFPGKPSKIISRKIVDSAKFILLEDNESKEAAENISYGLAMFNGSFGGDGQETAFHGFSPHDVEEAAEAAKEQITKVLAEYKDCGLNGNNKDLVPVVLDPPLPQTFENDPSLLPWIEVARKSHAWSSHPILETSSSTSLNCTTGNARKFVLPSRSIHSARVIKPNKRFLDIEEPSSVDRKDSCQQNKQLRTIELKKPRLILHDIKRVVTSSGISNQSDSNLFRAILSSGKISETSEKCHWKVCDKVQGGLSDLNVFGASVSQPCFHSIQSAKKCDNIGITGENDYFTLSSSAIGIFGKMGATVSENQKLCVSKRTSSKGVALPERSSDGPFTSQVKKRTGFVHSKVSKTTGTAVECGVCGAVRYYRFVKQARKFGIESCEACRKFIARMVIRARSEENFVKCLSGEGNCFVPAVIRSATSNSKENRCWACWLEKCVRSYIQMPENTRKSLIAMLPSNMRSRKTGRGARRVPSNQPVPRQPKARPKRKAGPLRRRSERPSRLKESKTTEISEPAKKKEPESIASAIAPSAIARQQLLQKGPRVKHVCRSASIVLGQPLAVFEPKTKVTSPTTTAQTTTLPSTSTKEVSPSLAALPKPSEPPKPAEPTKPAELPKPSEPEPCRQSSRLLESKLSKLASQSTNKESTSTNQPASGRRVTRLPQNSSSNTNSVPFRGHARSLQALSVYSIQPEATPDLVALDFWESYDPDEICNTGFGLIGCDPFQVRAVCFLCGSAGTSKLIHCASCCEPYHRFCVEMCASLPVEDKWLVDWVCPRCTVCNGCGWSTAPQVSCQRCDRSYHVNCLGATAIKAREKAPDRAWVCSLCLRCKSCNGPDVVKFVGNLPFCKPCFKLRRKGSFCPLCQCCYTDNDFHSKMMECAVCKAWFHAKCEGLSDEKYQVLSYLPETVEFVCRLCCTSPEAPWRSAVEAELKGGYLNVVKALTKNRKACTLLKWSPRKCCCSCQKPEVNSGRRRLSFSLAPSKPQRRISPPQKSPTEEVVKPEISLYDFDDELSEIGKYVNRSAKSKKGKESQDTESVSSQDKGAQFSPLTGSQSDSGIDDEFKTYSAAEDEETEMDGQDDVKRLKSCDFCDSSSPIPSLFQIKKKVNSDQYSSILEFHQDMDSVMNDAQSEELRDLYHYTLREVFPWFSPEYPNVSHNWREAASPCKPLQGSSTLSSFEKSASIPEGVRKLIEEGVAKMGNDYFYGGQCVVPDSRLCGLCKCKGDYSASEQGRLLYCGYNEWVHVNCALWSGEVFEEIDGSLQNINSALSRSRLIRCPACGKKGASVGCSAKNCEQTYHFPCARSVGCSFMEDKTVYCPSHVRDAQSKAPASEADFHVARPVYVELDRRKKKTVESRQVRLMIGSLLVESLGTIVPEVSDEGSTLVPTQFRCSRLFWSIKEPWRIVEYTVRTSVLVPQQEEAVTVHVTVDHSKESKDVVLDPAPKETSEQKEERREEPSLEVVRSVVNSLVDGVCARETEEEVSDPQNAADLLPPELKDAIFEELPHDLLDGISMQDIFPKFLSLEDPSRDDSEDPCDPIMQVMRDVRPSNNRGLNDVPSKNNLVNVTKRLKRSKSDVLPDHVTSADSRLHQRSCSLAWSCKLDSTITRCKRSLTMPDLDDRSRIIQQLHLSVTPASSMDAQFLLGGDKENHSIAWRHPPHIMQVDGAFDSESTRATSLTLRRFSSDVLARPLKETVVSMRKTGEASFATKKWCKSKAKMWRPRVNRPTTDKWQRSRRLSHDVIPQLDGAGEASSDSEADDSAKKTAFKLQTVHDLLEEQPVKCDRCYCTYRTEMSYTRHLPTCTGDLSMSSGSEEEHSEDEATVSTVTTTISASTVTASSALLTTPDPIASSTLTDLPTPVTTPVPTITPAPIVLLGPTPKSVPLATPSPIPIQTPIPTPSAIALQAPIASSAPLAPPVSNATPSSVTIPTPIVMPVVNQTPIITPSPIVNQTPIITPTPIVNQTPIITPSPIVNQTPIITPSPIVNQTPIITPSTAVAPTPVGKPSPTPTLVPVKPPVVVTQARVVMPQYTVRGKSVNVTPARTPLSIPSHQLIRAPNTMPRTATLKPATHVTLTTAAPTQARNTNVFGQPVCQVPQQPMVGMVDYQVQQQPNTPAVFVQCVPSPAMMPAYVDAFQQHTGQTLQHVATIDAHIPMEGAYITAVPNPVVPRTYHLQATPDGQLRLEPTTSSQLGLPSVGLQISQPVPQMMGTLLPNTLTYATTDGIYPQGNMLLTNSPMLTCMETVVSNTYMSMSQNQLVPGMLGSRSFSSTTTQVFQSKPNSEVPTSYVLSADSQLPNQLIVRSQPSTEPVYHLSNAQEQTPSEQIKLPDLFTQPLVTQSQTFSLPLPPVLAQTAAQSRPVQRTYSKSVKNWKPDVSPAGIAQDSSKTKPSRPLPALRPASTPPQPQILPNLLVSPAPAQSITLPDPIAPPLSTDESLCSPKAPSNPVNANAGSTPVRNCIMPKSIAVVHPIPVSTYAPHDRSKNTLFKKHSPPQTITASSDKTYCTTAQLSKMSVTKSDLATESLKVFATELGVEKLDSAELKAELSKLVPSTVKSASSVSVTTSAILTSVPSSSETLSFACKPSPRSSWPASVATQVTPSCAPTVVTSKPVSTVLPTSCLPSTKTLKENCSGTLPQTSSVKETADVGGSTKMPSIDLPPCTGDAPSAVTVAPPSITDPLVGKSVNRSSSLEPEPPTTFKLLFQKQAHSGRYKVSTATKLDSLSRPIDSICLKEKNSEKDQAVNNVGAGIAEGSENVKPGNRSPKKSQPNNSTPKIVYEIQSQDGFSYSSTSISDAWQKVFGAVQEARTNHNMARLVHNPFSGSETAHNVLGLGNNSLKYLVEQLPSVGQCSRYRPVYHKSRLPAGPSLHPSDDKPCPLSTSGCARTDPYMLPKRFDMFSWLDSRHRCPPKLLDNTDSDGLSGRRASSMNLPMAMRYRHLRETSRTSVGVFRSDIHGRGLFCLRDIEAGEMVIEYAGEVIRNTLTDNRERYYQSKGIGCYMFKVDENFTVDATRRGNAARFINHSCEPNCYSRVVDILGKKHIIIFAFRRIPQGEELTYDYKFPIEDEKISCHCLSRRCRKYLN